MKNQFLPIIFLCFISIFSCKKNSVTNVTLPILTTTSLSSISGTSATSGGTITSDGGATITARGVCWSTNPNPTTSDSKTSDGTNSGTFTSILSPLIPSTKYYVRAYASNSAGTAYGNELSLESSFVCGVSTVRDTDGNVYNTVSIGGQCWTKENLKTTKYNDNSNIPTGLSNVSWQSTTSGAYALYNDDVSNNTTYGKLYNWYAVNSGVLAPTGWHIPTETEWSTMVSSLGGESVAGAKMKSISSLWTFYSGISNTNSSGFSGLPGGYRAESGSYGNINLAGNWWASTSSSSTNASYHFLNYSTDSKGTGTYSKKCGFSVRCVKN